MSYLTSAYVGASAMSNCYIRTRGPMYAGMYGTTHAVGFSDDITPHDIVLGKIDSSDIVTITTNYTTSLWYKPTTYFQGVGDEECVFIENGAPIYTSDNFVWVSYTNVVTSGFLTAPRLQLMG